MRISDWSSDVCSSDLRSSIRCRHKLEIHHNGMFSALSARLTAVASRARALSIGSSSPVSSAKSKNARARQIVVLRIVDKTSSQPLSRFQVLLEIGTEFGDELRAQHSQLAVRRVIEHHLVADFRFEATEHDLARLLESRGAYGLSNGDAGSLGYQQQGSGEQLAFNRHIPALAIVIEGAGNSEVRCLPARKSDEGVGRRIFWRDHFFFAQRDGK